MDEDAHQDHHRQAERAGQGPKPAVPDHRTETDPHRHGGGGDLDDQVGIDLAVREEAVILRSHLAQK